MIQQKGKGTCAVFFHTDATGKHHESLGLIACGDFYEVAFGDPLVQPKPLQPGKKLGTLGKKASARR